MPVTAKFSEEFYGKLGHKVADELVDWFNKVDATYRSEFRELFATHFSRFDAKLEQRVSELDAKLERRVAEFHARFDAFEQKMTAALATQRAELMKWMFALWATLMIPILGLWLRG